MNRMLFGLTVVTLLFGSGLALSAQAFYWDSCKSSLKAYSIAIDGKSQDDLLKDQNVFDCAINYYLTSNRKKCENNYGLTNLSTEAKNFYNDCAIPYADYLGSHGTILDQCGGETDQCNFCLTDPTCATYSGTVNNQFPKVGKDLPNQNDYVFYPSVDKCEEMSENCPKLKLKDLAYNSCILYYTVPCQHTWLLKNAPKDPCLAYFECNDYVTLSGYFMKASFALVALFLTF